MQIGSEIKFKPTSFPQAFTEILSISVPSSKMLYLRQDPFNLAYKYYSSAMSSRFHQLVEPSNIQAVRPFAYSKIAG